MRMSIGIKQILNGRSKIKNNRVAAADHIVPRPVLPTIIRDRQYNSTTVAEIDMLSVIMYIHISNMGMLQA